MKCLPRNWWLVLTALSAAICFKDSLNVSNNLISASNFKLISCGFFSTLLFTFDIFCASAVLIRSLSFGRINCSAAVKWGLDELSLFSWISSFGVV